MFIGVYRHNGYARTMATVCRPALFNASPNPGKIGMVASERALGVKKWGMMEVGAPIVRME